MAFRFITGLGLGTELPVAFTILVELMPANRRARMTGWMVAVGSTNNYPVWMRRQRMRPIRAFIQIGTKELNIALGDLRLASEEMASALKYRDYGSLTTGER
ncbi:hypothetical protein [Rhodococcus sp. NPDC055024]